MSQVLVFINKIWSLLLESEQIQGCTYTIVHWFSKLKVHQNPAGNLLDILVSCILEVCDSEGLEWSPQSAFLKSSQVMSMLSFEDHMLKTPF